VHYEGTLARAREARRLSPSSTHNPPLESTTPPNQLYYCHLPSTEMGIRKVHGEVAVLQLVFPRVGPKVNEPYLENVVTRSEGHKSYERENSLQNRVQQEASGSL
jgi:hypothetical protein